MFLIELEHNSCLNEQILIDRSNLQSRSFVPINDTLYIWPWVGLVEKKSKAIQRIYLIDGKQPV